MIKTNTEELKVETQGDMIDILIDWILVVEVMKDKFSEKAWPTIKEVFDIMLNARSHEETGEKLAEYFNNLQLDNLL